MLYINIGLLHLITPIKNTGRLGYILEPSVEQSVDSFDILKNFFFSPILMWQNRHQKATNTTFQKLTF